MLIKLFVVKQHALLLLVAASAPLRSRLRYFDCTKNSPSFTKRHRPTTERTELSSNIIIIIIIILGIIYSPLLIYDMMVIRGSLYSNNLPTQQSVSGHHTQHNKHRRGEQTNHLIHPAIL